MVTRREKWERWLTEVIAPSSPELLPLIHAVMDAADRIDEQGSVTEANLEAIVRGVRSSRRPLYEYASDVVGHLTADFEEFRTIVRELAEDKSAQVRFNAILCLDERTPPELCEQILRSKLLDRSTKVRSKAADWILRLHLEALVPDLEMAISQETKEKVRSSMEFSLGLVRDKYLLRPTRDGYDVVIRSNGIVGSFITQQELDDEGIDAIVARLYREEEERTARRRALASRNKGAT